MDLSLANIRRRAPLMAWTLIVLMAVVPLCQHNWSEVVFCVEASGEINLESRHQGGHTTSDSQDLSAGDLYAQPEAYLEQVQFNHNEVCIDLSLQLKGSEGHIGALTIDGVSVDIDLPVALPLILPNAREDEPAPSAFMANREADRSSTTSNLPSLQTVVLLI